MKIYHLLIGLQVLILISCSNHQHPKTTEMNDDDLYNKASIQADSLLMKLTLDEKISLMGGVDYFFSNEITRLGINRVMMTDATGGVHLRDEFEGMKFEKPLEKSTAFPAPIALAATWNKKLAYDYAKSIGEECRAAGIPVLLGPGMNIYRVSQCGRNFEYFGEDPFLASRMIENYVTGIQSTGTIATLKHFVANNTDFFRRKSNSIVDERTLHEIYMPAFKAGIDAGAKAVMTSYNLLHNEWCGESSYVINQLLRKELGFKWMVMTDWWSVQKGEQLIKSGQNIEMPSAHSTKEVHNWLAEGKITAQQIEEMIKPQLATFLAMNSCNIKPDSSLLSLFSIHEATALQTAREGIVLLKNDRSVLPIKSDENNLLAMGYYLDADLKGGGSAEVLGYNHVSLRKALKNEFTDRITILDKPTDDMIKNASHIILSIGTQDSEGYDRPFELPEEMEQMVQKVTNLNSNTIVVVNSGSGIRMTDWNDKAAAILYSWYLGQNGFQALAEIVSGKVNPSGKLPMTIEKEFADTPGYGYMLGEPFYVGWNGEGERAHSIYDVSYNEGILVGYRWFDTKKIEPLYAFGHGLSYAQFEYKNVIVNSDKDHHGYRVVVTCNIKNIGDVDGSETVQLYVSDNESSVLRPTKELKAFEKISLKAGEMKQVSFVLTDEDFSFYNQDKKEWVLELGEFNIFIGKSSRDILLRENISL